MNYMEFRIRDTGSTIIADWLVDGSSPIRVYSGSLWAEVEEACKNLAQSVGAKAIFKERETKS